jgi:predicted metal-binding membrane protein
MIINSCTVNQHGQNMLQLQVSISCPVKRQAIVILLSASRSRVRTAGSYTMPPGQPGVYLDMSMPGTVTPDERPLTIIESALRYDRAPLVVMLVLLPVVSWAWIVAMARDMYGPMTGASAWMMTATWDVPHLLLLWAMWAVMMIAMMVPAASPMLLGYGVIARRSAQRSAAQHIYALAAGYVLVWTTFSFAATALQRGLATVQLVSPMMEMTDRVAGATLLFIAGLYQLTPLKRACLTACQSPLAFLLSHWRSGLAGAFSMGIKHGAYCVGCCWALMLLLFVGGVMNLTVIVALTTFVAFEKLAPFGANTAWVSGALLIAAGVWLLVR